LLLTHLRYFGFVFNPVSFYFCLDAQGKWETMVAEVSNTPWNQKHCYIVDRAAQEKSLVAAGGQVTAKVFHVSPFLSMDYGYRWSVKINPAQLVVHIENIPLEKALGEQRPTPTVIGNPGTEEASAGPPVRTGRGGKVFNVTLSLQKRPLSRFQRWRVMMAFPAITGLVVWRIYWQAFRLWWKRVPYVPHPGLRESQQSTDGGDRGPISVSS